MPVYTFPDVYAEEKTVVEGPIQATALGFGGLIGVSKKGPVGVPIRARSYNSWKEIFGGEEAASRGDSAYEVKAFFDEGGFEMIFVRQANYTDLDDKTTFTGGVSSRTHITDGVAATAATKTGAVGTYNIPAGATFGLDVDNGGVDTITFDAAAGSITDTTTYPVADQVGLTLSFAIDGGAAQLVTFAAATTTALLVAAEINNQVIGASATVTGGQVVVTSDTQGTGSSVAVTPGTSALTWAAAVAGTGDSVNAAAVTALEVKTVIEADTSGACTVTVNANGSFTISAPTPGATSELDFQAGTALTPLGLSVETILGTAAGATYNTLKLEAGYRGYRSPGLDGNNLKTKITQNPKQAASGVGNSLTNDITIGDSTIQVVTTAGINVGSVIKVWDGTNTEYKEVTAVRPVVAAGSVTFYVDISGTFTYGYLDAATQLQTQEFDIQIYENDVLVETWTQLSMLDTVENYVETKLNDENFGSKYVYSTDMDAAPGLGADIPATDSVATALTGGTDETTGMTDADWIGTQTGKTGVYAFDDVNHLMPIATLGNNNAVVAHAASQYCQSRIWFDYYGYVDQGMAGADAVSYRNNVLGIDSSYMWLFAGGMEVFDPLGTGSNPKRKIAGLGAAMGVRARVDTMSDSGAWEAAAGEGDFGRIKTALDVGTEYSDYEHGLMNDVGINVFRKFTNTSPVLIWGARTLDASTAQKFRYDNVRWFFQFCEKSVVDSTRWSVFRLNNETTWSKLRTIITEFLSGLLGDGAFPTNEASKAFFVKVGITDGVMDQDDYDNGRLKGKIGLAPNKPGEFVIFEFSQYESGVDIAEV